MTNKSIHGYRTMMRGKIHRATVTQADLDYVGSITVDQNLLDAAGIIENEMVHVLDITNGNRIETYALNGERGSGIIGINGAAAHLVNPKDLVIIVAYGLVPERELEQFNPQVVFVDAENKMIDLIKEKAGVKLLV